MSIRFTPDGNNLINSGGVTLIDVPLTANGQADTEIILYETVSSPDTQTQSGIHPLVLRCSERPFDTVRVLVKPKVGSCVSGLGEE